MTPREQLIKFFKALDAKLDKPYKLTAVGGSAMVIGYGSTRATTDFDSLEQGFKGLQDRFKEASKETGVNLDLDTPGGFILLPENYEDRLDSPDLQLKNLTIRYLEKHDLALSKIRRYNGADLDDILWLHQNHILDSEILVHRYIDELRPNHVAGTKRALDLNFLDMVEELYGPTKKSEIEKRIKS